MGIALDPNFATNGWVYVYYAPDSANNSDPANFFSRVSRFTVDANNDIDPASEKVIITVPASREPDEPGHTGGNLDFDLQGNLLLGVGDDVNPHSEPSGGYAPLNERADRMWDARQTSANTNDLRGKLLRVKPKADGGYDIPAGNLFDEAQDAENKTRPEIYAMGFRNPWKFSVDPNTGWIGLADYAPDNSTNAPNTRGPAGIVEYNVIKEPGNYGWPLCMGNNEPFRDVDYMTTPVTVGPFFDCANPVNDSIKNTGLRNLPPVKAPDMWYGYTQSSVPGAIPAGGGLAPMGGPFYKYDAALDVGHEVPAVLRRQGLLLRLGQEQRLDRPARRERARSRRSTPSCRTRRSWRRSRWRSGPTARSTRWSGAAATAVTTRTRASTGSTTSTARARRWPSARRRPTTARSR